MREAGARHVVAQRVGDLDDLRRGRDVVGGDFLQPVDVLEDAAQLLGVELLVAGLEGDAGELRNVTDLGACQWHAN